jgi:formate/nitrite transporter FocA (FNT family)
MLPTPLEQFVAGIAAALILCSVLWWTPIARKLLGALAVAGILNLLIADRNVPSVPDHEALPRQLVQELIGYPYLSIAAAIVITLALLFTSRSR